MQKGQKYPTETLTTREIKALFKQFPPSAYGDRHRGVVAICLYAQARISEVCNLRPCDIGWEEGTITILQGKGGKRRVAGILPEFLEEFVRPWDRVRPESEFFFCTAKGNMLHGEAERLSLKRAGKKAGLSKRMYLHMLRHSGSLIVAKALRHGKVDLRHIQAQLGHSSLETTARYIANICPTETIEAIHSVSWS